MSKPAKYVPSLVNPHTATSTSEDYHTTYQLCNRLDFPMLDWYPCRTWEDNSNISFSGYSIWGATDLIPAGTSSSYYNAYMSRDELWAVENQVGPAVFHVFEVTGETQFGSPNLVENCSFEIDHRGDFRVASSDYRSSDIGDRSAAGHNMNSAVVFYEPGEDANQAEVVFHDGSGLVIDNMPGSSLSGSTVLFCVGEADYGQAVPGNPNPGIIGRSDMRILWYGSEEGEGSISIFGKNINGTDLIEIDNLVYESNFIPEGALWGYFWDTEATWLDKSGFVLYDASGDYIVVHKDDDTNSWQISDDNGVPFSDLFGVRANQGSVMAYREIEGYQFSPSHDFLVSIVGENNPPVHRPFLQWCYGGDDYAFEIPGSSNEVVLDGIPGFAFAHNFNHLEFRRTHSGDVRFWIGGDETATYFTGIADFPSEWEDEASIATSPSGWDVLNTMRVRYTRRPWVNALLYNYGTGKLSIRAGEIVDGFSSAEHPESDSSLDLFFNNPCSEGANYYTADHFEGAFDLEFEYGINLTPEVNCLFANIQSFGRGIWSHFYPSADTLLYMTVSPIIHGCRGISFYALDLALFSGAASSGGSSPLNRPPGQFLDWQPSRDSQENVDMISRVDDVVSILTGNSGGPDFLSALVDHSSYTVLDTGWVYNADCSTNPVFGDDKLNFIALRESSSEDILLMVSNDNEDMCFENSNIVFPKYKECNYEAPVCCGGWGDFTFSDQSVYSTRANCIPESVPTTVYDQISRGSNADYPVRKNTRAAAMVQAFDEVITLPLSEPPVIIDFQFMPPHSVSLIYLHRTLDTGNALEESEEPVMRSFRNENGEIVLEISGVCGDCDLNLYDLSGRIVDEMHLMKNCGAQQYSFDRYNLGAGMYFAVLTGTDDMSIVEKVVVFR